MALTARYSSTCAVCGAAIKVGALIERQAEAWRHATCKAEVRPIGRLSDSLALLSNLAARNTDRRPSRRR